MAIILDVSFAARIVAPAVAILAEASQLRHAKPWLFAELMLAQKQAIEAVRQRSFIYDGAQLDRFANGLEAFRVELSRFGITKAAISGLEKAIVMTADGEGKVLLQAVLTAARLLLPVQEQAKAAKEQGNVCLDGNGLPPATEGKPALSDDERTVIRVLESEPLEFWHPVNGWGSVHALRPEEHGQYAQFLVAWHDCPKSDGWIVLTPELFARAEFRPVVSMLALYDRADEAIRQR